MKRNKRTFFFTFIAVFIMALACVLRIGPRLISYYYQVKAGNLLNTGSDLVKTATNNALACELPSVDELDWPRLEEANTILKKTVRVDPRISQSHFLIGQIECLLNRPENAIKSLLVYTQLRPRNPLGHLELGFAFGQLCKLIHATHPVNQSEFLPLDFCRDPELSQKIASELELAGLSASSFITKGQQFVQENNFSKAIDYLGLALELQPNAWEPEFLLGKYYEKQNDIPNAISAYQLAISKAPGEVEIYNALGNLMLTKTKDLHTALETFQSAIDIDPISVEAHLGVGLSLDRLGDNNGAVNAYKEAIALSSLLDETNKDNRRNRIWPIYKIGEVYFRIGKIIEAKEAFQQAIEKDPYREWADYSLWALGRIHRQEKQFFSAEGYFLEALKVSKFPYLRSLILTDLARTKIDKKELDQAILSLTEAREEDPSNRDAWILLADTLKQAGKYDVAIKEYQEMLKLWPNDENIVKKLEETDELHRKSPGTSESLP